MPRLRRLGRSLLPWLLVGVAAGAVACDSDSNERPDPEENPPKAWESCQASDEAYVRRVHEAVLGASPESQEHVTALASTYRGFRDSLGEAEARGALVRLLAASPEFAERWTDAMMDVLNVPRITKRLEADYGVGRAVGCYTTTVDDDTRDEIREDGGELAAFVRDNNPSAEPPPLARFTMSELLRSSVVLDDVTPVLRANIFHLMNFVVVGMNVGADELERIRRLDLANSFMETYLNRNVTCLQCHNSEFSVTYTPDPATNRTWAIPGFFEAALFGDSAALSASPLEYASVFRVEGVKVDGSKRPWGWSERCGEFTPPVSDDPLGIDARFGAIRSTSSEPRKGLRASAWSLEVSLQRGLEALRGREPTLEGGDVDPDQALAYLTALAVTERLWREIVGTDLTIAMKFPRTEIQRDTLRDLAAAFTSGGYSLRALITAIVSHPAFNVAAPGAECWESDYPMPPIYNAWTPSDPDPEKQGNGPSDRIGYRNPRTQLRHVTEALGWPRAEPFPEGDDREFQTMVGVFSSPVEPGFRGVDFQARLAWEERFAACESPGGGPDFVTDLAARAQARGATLEDAFMVLRDRITGIPEVPDDERPAWESLVGMPLASAAGADAEARLRALCGVLLSSPQFLLDGLPIDRSTAELVLTRDTDKYAAACDSLRGYASAAGLDPTAVCSAEAEPP